MTTSTQATKSRPSTDPTVGAAKAAANGASPVADEEAVAVQPVEQRAVTPQSEYGDDVGAGLEGLDSGELLIPFVRMLQALSPVCVEGSQAYDPDMRPGMIIHTATGEAFPKDLGVGFIPCVRDSSYTEWVPIQPGTGTAGGGGFRGTWSHDDPRVAQMIKEQGAFKKLHTSEGTELVETRTLYGIVVPRQKDGTWVVDEATNGVISFSSTQLKKYRMIITRLTSLVGKPARYPIFAWRWNLTTQPEKNKFGSYYGWKLALDGETANQALMKVGDPLYQLARELHSLVRGGLARADFAASGVAAEDTVASPTGASTTADIDEEIPF